jgi:polysaccharide export outer membrane protein
MRNITRRIVPLLALALFILGSIPALLAALAPARAEGGRVLTTNDVVQVGVLNQPEFAATARVEPDGTVALAFAGRLKAAGRTTGALAAEIVDLLKTKGLVKDPKVTVELSSFGQQVSVLGAVGEPGVFTLDRPTRLAQILARAGGLRDDAVDSAIVVHRALKALRFDARAVLEGREGARFLLANNDTVYVEQPRVFYLYGYVAKPGQYALNRPGLTVRQAIALGGGLSPLGSDFWGLKIRRAAQQETPATVQEIPATLEDPIEPNDTIVVNERLF